MLEENLNLTTVLGWGSLDVEFLENLISDNKLDTDEILDEIESIEGDKTEINTWIFISLQMSAYNFLNDVEYYAENNNIKFDIDAIDVDPFVNYLDSFLNGNKLNSEIDISDHSDENIADYLKWLNDK